MIHQFKQNGLGVVVDVFSGAIHLVDDVAYDVISLYETHTKEQIVDSLAQKYASENLTCQEIAECFDEITQLKEDGQLFTKDTFAPISTQLKEKTSGVVKALCLHVAHTCNLNCSYCFASQGKYSGDRALMSEEVGKRALDFLIENSGTRHNLEVDFFGGEPLMNFDVVKNLVAYARQREKETGKNFRFTLTTNGVLIDQDVIDFANKEMSNVVLSLDGRKEIHDKFRVDYSGRGSFDKIVPKFQQLVKARDGKDYYMRGTFTHANPDFVKDVKTMLDLGFDQLSMEPVVCASDDPSALTDQDLIVVMQQYEELAQLMLERRREGKPFTFYHYMIDLSGGPCIYKRVSGCGSGTEYMAVTPWGDLYPCHQFVGDEQFKLGDVYKGVTNFELQNQFKQCNVYAHAECSDCWAKLYCSGGCAANAYHATGKITGVYESGCKLFKKRMECAIYLEALKSCEEQDENSN
ncbi:MAG: thioether cross-link-forming SCIFF peptide maturase [Clostridia bacterium]|nr:thioether cross-link-forming SCIFF peptide maturase [Clostridia bacterium]